VTQPQRATEASLGIALVVHQYLPDHVGGTEVYTWSLAEALSSQGHRVTVFYPVPGATADEQGTLDTHQVWRAQASGPPALTGPLGAFWRTFRNPRVEHSYRQMLQTVQPDIVHVQHLQNVSARLPALTGARPLFLTFHDYWYRCATGQLVRSDDSRCEGPSLRCADCARARATEDLPALIRPLIALPMAYRNLYLSWMLTHVDRFVAPSAFVRDQYVRWGFDAGRISVLAHGVDLGRLAASRAKPASRTEGTVFGYLGSIAPSKGIHVLVQAFEEMPLKAELIIYGSPDTFPDYARQLKALSHHPGVRFGGALPPQAIGSALGALDYLVVPSLTHETFSMVVAEAHALGVPVVASRLGALTRIVDGVNGRLFEAGDVPGLAAILRELVGDGALRARYAAAIPPVISTEEHARTLVGMYRQALAARR
jgi:glycosyltransferase involved in cell wall biosynthesis